MKNFGGVLLSQNHRICRESKRNSAKICARMSSAKGCKHVRAFLGFPQLLRQIRQELCSPLYRTDKGMNNVTSRPVCVYVYRCRLPEIFAFNLHKHGRRTKPGLGRATERTCGHRQFTSKKTNNRSRSLINVQ